MSYDVRTGPPQEPHPLDMRETDPSTIDGQIEAGLAAHNGSTHSFLNNFDGYFPGGYKLRLAETVDALDELNSAGQRSAELHSVRFMNETMREFAGSVDRAVSAVGLDREKLEDLRADLDDAHMQNDDARLIEAREAYCAFVLPVYRQLRTEGYTHYDLEA